jgi:predicted Zn-dependent peptidase
MDVNVGAFSDEEDMPGMAHAVEHVCGRSTQPYPATSSEMLIQCDPSFCSWAPRNIR